ncbi:hypothetical protein X926_09465 [Petrotoga sp. HWHPT.55.6.3]|nr:hypothetical protein X926_09465 [Petrotoga sp. HWHPT.55.6.3]
MVSFYQYPSGNITKNLGGENQRPDPGHPYMKGDITT